MFFSFSIYGLSNHWLWASCTNETKPPKVEKAIGESPVIAENEAIPQVLYSDNENYDQSTDQRMDSCLRKILIIAAGIH